MVAVLPALSVAVTTSALAALAVRLALSVACHAPLASVVAVPIALPLRVIAMTEPTSALPRNTTLAAVLVRASPSTPVSEAASKATVGASGTTLSLTTVRAGE